jgi:hypothetical protein
VVNNGQNFVNVVYIFLARTTATWNVDFIMESSDPARLPIKIRRAGEQGAEDDYMNEDSPDVPEKYPIYDAEKGTITVKVTKGNQL